MFNLLIGVTDGVVPAGRLFEYTEDGVKQQFAANLAALQDLPVLLMPETGNADQEQVARIGRVVGLRAAGRTHTFTFVPDPAFGQLESATVEKLATKLGITGWEFQRTHWAVKDADLFAVLLENQLQQSRVAPGNFASSGAVQFPVHAPRDPSLVAVMMPFDKSFDIVYETIAQSSADAGLTSVRADDIWEHDHVMGDVLSLIWRSAIVVSDLTGKNTNVFYETGLAHALPRRTVLLTQNAGDVPFDLQALRYLHYGVGTAERAALRKVLAERLTTLANQPLV